MFSVPVDKLRKLGAVFQQLEDLDSGAHHSGRHRVTEQVRPGPLTE